MKIGKRLGFIGSGKMAAALIEGMLSSKIVKKGNIISTDRDKAQLRVIRIRFGIRTLTDNKKLVKNSDIVFICVKPQDSLSLFKEIKNISKNKLFVSIMAGIKINKIMKGLNSKRVIRVMPNTPALVGKGVFCYAKSSKATKNDVKIVDKLLSSCGATFKVKEKDLDAVTALSGSGPAFFSYFIDALVRGAVKEGLRKEIAYKLSILTAIGTGELLMKKNLKPEELIKMVSSPKGTTVEGLKVLKKIDQDLIKTIKNATKRSRQLSK